MSALLQLNATANRGSTGKIAEAIGLAAKRRGWESYVAYGRHAAHSQSELIRVGDLLNPYVHYLQSRLFDREGLASGAATSRLIWLIDKLAPDIVQLHNIHDHWLNYRLLFEYLNSNPRIQVVWTFHDCWPFTGHCFHFVQVGCVKWKTACANCPLSKVYPKSMIDRSRRTFELKCELFSSCRNLTIVACSQWMADMVRSSFLGDRPVEVLYNGVDISQFHPMGVRSHTGGFNVLAVSDVWNREKGLDDICALRCFLPSDFNITVVGLTAEQIRSMPPGISAIGHTDSVAELIQLYSGADVLVNASYADTFPTVNLEALACGTPVVTYATGGSPEAVDDRTGAVVTCGDVRGMAEAVKSMRDNPLSRHDCRSRAVENFNRDTCFEKYIDLYDKNIAGHPILPSGKLQE